MYTVSPKTRTSHVTHSVVSSPVKHCLTDQNKKRNIFKEWAAERPWRNSTVFDTFTPTWKRFVNTSIENFYLESDIAEAATMLHMFMILSQWCPTEQSRMMKNKI